MLNSLTGCHERLIWTPSRICGVRWRGQCRKPGPAHILNVLLATRQPHRWMNYELVMQVKTRPKLVPTVRHSPSPTPPPSSHLLLSWNSDEGKTTLETGDSQAHPSHTQQLFLCIFQIVLPSVKSLGSLWPAKHQWLWHAWSRSHLSRDPFNQNDSKQEIMKK